MVLTSLSDEALLSGLDAICGEGRRVLARLLLHLIEVDERRLHLKTAYPSLFELCTVRLGMSEGAAYRRITAARLVRKFPSLLERIERGAITLSSLVLLKDHLTSSTLDELVEAASGKSKRQVEELVARLAPKPDVRSLIRKLPTSGSAPPPPPPPANVPSVSPRQPQARIEPLAPARYKVQLTASAELREKLERAVDLMRHRSPTGDLAVVIELAMDGLLEKLEKEARGKTARPQRTPRASKPDHVKRSVRREVFERDGAQCTFADAEGHRCSSRAFLELDHIESRALGGSSDASNLRVLCRAHNQLHAEEVFGRENVARQIHVRQRTLARVEMPKTSIAEVTCLGPRRSAVLTHSILRLAG